MEKYLTIDELERQSDVLLEKYDKQKNIEYLINIENLFEIYLKENRDANEIALRFVIFLFEDLHNDYKAMDILENIIEKDPNNIKAALIMAYLDFTLMLRDEDFSLEILYELKTTDPEELSMIEFVKSLYYSKFGEYQKHELCLKKSIQYYDKHVKNNYFLGSFFIDVGRKYEGKKLIEKALINIQLIYIYLAKRKTTISTPEKFIDEHIKGIHLTEPNVEAIENELKRV